MPGQGVVIRQLLNGKRKIVSGLILNARFYCVFVNRVAGHHTIVYQQHQIVGLRFDDAMQCCNLNSGQQITGLDFGNHIDCDLPTSVVHLAGVQDNFSTANGIESASPSTALVNYINSIYPNPSQHNFDGNNPDRAFGLIAHTRDISPRLHFGYKNPNCEPGTFAGETVCLVPEEDTEAALLSIRDGLLAPYPNVGTFYTDAAAHTSLTLDDFYERETDGVRLVDWVRAFLRLEPAGIR